MLPHTRLRTFVENFTVVLCNLGSMVPIGAFERLSKLAPFDVIILFSFGLY